MSIHLNKISPLSSYLQKEKKVLYYMEFKILTTIECIFVFVFAGLVYTSDMSRMVLGRSMMTTLGARLDLRETVSDVVKVRIESQLLCNR